MSHGLWVYDCVPDENITILATQFGFEYVGGWGSQQQEYSTNRRQQIKREKGKLKQPQKKTLEPDINRNTNSTNNSNNTNDTNSNSNNNSNNTNDTNDTNSNNNNNNTNSNNNNNSSSSNNKKNKN